MIIENLLNEKKHFKGILIFLFFMMSCSLIFSMENMNIKKIVAGPVETNSYICWTENKDCIVIDPSGDGEEIKIYLVQNKLILKYIINTHGHADHISGNKILKSYGTPLLCIHKDDASLLLDPALNDYYKVFPNDIISPPADRFLKENDIISIGKYTIKIIEIPGHSRGSIGLIIGNLFFSGDTLFCGAIGRTNILGASKEGMIRSLRKIKSLNKNFIVYPGHGRQTTLEREINDNLYLQQFK